MHQNRLILLFMSLSLVLGLCACGQNGDIRGETKPYAVSLEAAAGTGYYWVCTLSEEGFVAFESEQQLSDSLSAGSPVTTDFYFTGKKQGSVTATFCCQQSWDDSVSYLYTCDLTVDREKVVTGELSRQTARIRPGDGEYQLTASDTSIVLWDRDSDGSYLFTPLRNGSLTLTFTALDQSEGSDRIFYLSVAEDETFTITENTGLASSESYASLAELEKKTGFSMGVPEDASINEINSVETLAYVSFTWHEIGFAYAGGALDLDSFLGPDTHVSIITGNKFIIQNSVGTMAAWKQNGTVYCITSDETVQDSELTTLLRSILAAQLLPETQKTLSR